MLRARRAAAGLLGALAVGLGLGGCASGATRSLPSGCFSDPTQVSRALDRAPARVALPDGTELSDCARLAVNDADLQNLGVVLVDVGEDLASQVPGSDHAAVELGYLVGAVQRARSGDNGVHAELERRLEQTMPSDAPSARLAAYRRGLEAGRRGGGP